MTKKNLEILKEDVLRIVLELGVGYPPEVIEEFKRRAETIS